MKNTDTYKNTVITGTEIRKYINGELHPRMGKLSLLFEYLTGVNRRVFIYVKDMLYYAGGWPSENTPPRMESLIHKVSDLVRILEYLNIDDTFKQYCTQYGITITNNVQLEIQPISKKNIKKFIDKHLDGRYDDNFDNTKDTILKILDEGLTLQSEICKSADEIKINHANTVMNECEVNKAVFCKTVNLNASKSKKIDVKIKDLTNESNNMIESMTLLQNMK